jgi:hypothetical protein
MKVSFGKSDEKKKTLTYGSVPWGCAFRIDDEWYIKLYDANENDNNRAIVVVDDDTEDVPFLYGCEFEQGHKVDEIAHCELIIKR